MDENKVKDLKTLMQKMAKHFPEKEKSQEYMSGWMQQAPPPLAPPLKYLTHDYVNTLETDSATLGDLENYSIRDDAVHAVKVIRRRGAKRRSATIDMPLASYIRFRSAQGVEELTAVAEWRGAQIAS